MSIRLKALLATGLLLLALVLANHFIVAAGLEHQLAAAEETHLLTATEGLDNTVREFSREFRHRVATIAARDDTYEFAVKPNREYVRANLNPAALHNRDITALVIVNRVGRVLMGTGYDRDAKRRTNLPPELGQHLGVDHPLVQFSHLKGVHSGLLVVGSAVMVVSAMPILDSEGRGPSRGTLVAGRTVDAEVTRELSMLAEAPLQLFPLSSPSLPEDVLPVLQSLKTPGDRLVRRLGEEEAAGYMVLRDVLGKPVLLRGTFEQEIYAEGLQARQFLVMTLLLVGLCFSVGTIVLIWRVVLVPVAALARGVALIETGRDPKMRLEVRSSDEVGQLGTAVNAMLDALQSALQREEHLKQEVAQLRIEIDHGRVQRQVSEVADTDFFKDLQERADEMRRNLQNEVS